MSDIGHSTLLKFFVNTSKMSEQSGKTDSTITSKVPGEQTLRGDYIHELQNEKENGVAIKEYTVSPVIKVKKEESTFTKGDLKVEKVIVSEDISDETANSNRKLTISELTSPNEVQTGVYKEVSSITINTEGDTQTSTGDQKVVYKVTKIPKLKFKQVLKKIKKEEETIKEGKDEAELGLKVTETISNLKDEKNLLQEVSRSDSIQQDSPKVDDEFDRIYDEIFEHGPPSGNFPSPGKIEDPEKLDTKFEEIIHAYDEQKTQTTNAEKIKSKIPLLKRKSEQDIFAAKRTIRNYSLKKRNSVDDTKCKLPVPFTREKQNVELELPQNQKTVSAKNVTVFETVNTNISKSITTTSHQNYSEKYITQETEFNTKSEVSKCKSPTHLKNIVVTEKALNIQNSESSSKLGIEKKSENIFINTVRKNETQEPKPVVTEDDVKTLNVKDNISKIETKSLIIKDNIEKDFHTNDNKKKDTITNIIVEKDIVNRNPVTESETKTHIITKVNVNNLKPINDLAQIVKPLDPKNSNNDFHETNKPSENKFSKTEVQTINVNETNSSVSMKQEVRETVKIVCPQFPNSEINNIHHDQKDKISDNITNNIPKDISHIPGPDVYLETNSLAKDITYNDNKNKLSDENTKRSDNINIDSKNATNITEQISLKIQDNVSLDISKSNNDIISNNLSQEYTIKKLVSEPTQKSLDSSLKTSKESINIEINKELLNSTAVDTKQDKTILITNQQSETKIQPQELTKELTKIIKSQEHLNKSENISKKITTEINNNETNTEDIKEKKSITVIASNNEVNSSENNENDNIELEEDIIILKGKVNRIISRLDSKEFKVNKCEIEDLPPEETVVSKIALFEQSKPMDKTQKASITKNKVPDEINLDKPKIVDEVLKIENVSLHSESKFSYDTFLNYKKTIKNESISSNENKVQTISKAKSITKFDEIYNSYINLNKFNKTSENKVGSTEDVVYLKNEKANRNIINEYKMNKEIDLDMRRARSLAELNFDGVQGRVRQMVVRMNSIDKMALERREQNEIRKKTRHGSVSERIALFERDANEQTVHLMKKVTPIRMESVSTTTSSSKAEEFTPSLTEDELAKRITELAQARVTYGHYDNMTYIELSDGGRLPSLVVGTALLDSQLVKPIIKAAIDLGFRAIDTAYIYGNEQAVGEAIREKIQDGTVKREELFVLSKLWSTNHRHDLVLRACRQSLDVMGLDYFDLYLIHNPMSFKEGPNPVPKIANVLQYSEHDYLEAWFGIETLIKQGLVKRGGVSNFNSMQLERVLDKGKIKPVVNQVECHPYLSQARLQDYMSSRGMAMSCFGSLGSSGTPRAFRSSLPPVINDPLVRTMAAGLGITPAQLLISYQVLLGRSVVVKASSAAHLWDNLHALSQRLEPAHAAGLAALNRNKRTFTFEGMGDTHKNYPFKIPF